MVRLLVAYGTTEGQTRRIAARIAHLARTLGVQACVADAGEEPDLGVDGFDAVILAGSLHAGTHQQELMDFARRHLSGLAGRHTAFVSVSLSAAGGAEDRAKAIAAAQAFLRRAGWQPDEVHLVAGAFRYTRYGFLKRWIMKRIARLKGAPTDASRDWELTDWADLELFVQGFLTNTASKLQPSGTGTAMMRQPAADRVPLPQG